MHPREALKLAQEEGLDLVEISPHARPPVCKIIDYGKFKYQQAKKEKESKKVHQQIKIKKIKMKPNIDEHDFFTKANHAREFLLKGNKVQVICMFRGREMLHVDLGKKLLERLIKYVEDLATVESEPKLVGRFMSMVFNPLAKGGKKVKEKSNA